MRQILSLLPLLQFALSDGSGASSDAATTDSQSLTATTFDCSSVSTANWVALNHSVGGRLYTGVPYGRPCYSKYVGPLGTFSGSDVETCKTRIDNSANDLWRQYYFGSYGDSVAEGCTSKGQFCTYGASSTNLTMFDPRATCYQGSVPTYYIDVKGADDVAKAFDFVDKHHLQLTIKGAGHEWWGRSSGPGSLGLWTYNLKDIIYKPTFVQTGAPHGTPITPAVTVGAGVVFDEIYKFAHANNFTFFGGACPSVGASGGYFMGGGIGALANTMGMGSDRVIEFKIVTPDGKLRIANAYQNSDLFFAVRGGGPASYGVVLETTHKVDPAHELQAVFIFFDSNVAGVQKGFYETVVNNTLVWANAGWGGYLFSNGISYVNPRLNATAAAASMAPLLTYLNGLPSGSIILGSATIQSLPSFYEFEYDLMGPIVLGGSGGSSGSAPAGRILQERHFNTDAAKVQTAKTILDFIDLLHQTDQGMPQTNFVIQVSGPYLYSKEHPDAVTTTGLAPAWRSGIMYVESQFGWDVGASVDEIKSQYKAAHDSIAGLRSITPTTSHVEGGGYMNEGDMYAVDWQNDFFGSHYPKLLAIKKKWDPKNLLKPCWKCVGWTGPNDDRFKCYFKSI